MSERNHNRSVYDVRLPSAHEGVGRALRGAYESRTSGLPEEFADLLAKLV